MTERHNCPNCGAPISSFECPYCGTQFFDFSNINLDDRKPIFLRIKHNGSVHIFKTILTNMAINITSEPGMYMCRDISGRIAPITMRNKSIIEMEFESI